MDSVGPDAAYAGHNRTVSAADSRPCYERYASGTQSRPITHGASKSGTKGWRVLESVYLTDHCSGRYRSSDILPFRNKQVLCIVACVLSYSSKC